MNILSFGEDRDGVFTWLCGFDLDIIYKPFLVDGIFMCMVGSSLLDSVLKGRRKYLHGDLQT